MKRVLSICLSVVILLSIGLFGGCSQFDGDYQVIVKDEALELIGNINGYVYDGYSYELYEETTYEDKEENNRVKRLKAKMTKSPFTKDAVGEWVLEEEKDGELKYTKYICDDFFAYKEIEVDGKTQKSKSNNKAGYATFSSIRKELEINAYIDTNEFLTSKYIYPGKFYIDTSSKDTIKLKIEDENYHRTLIFIIKTMENELESPFISDDDYVKYIDAVKYEEYKTETYTTNNKKTILRYKRELTIEKWDGEISAPSDAEDYTTVENILK